MTTRLAKKVLFTLEDTCSGVGTVSQNRGGVELTLHKTDLPVPVNNEAELKALDTSKFMFARVYESISQYVDYVYDPQDTSGIPPDIAIGSWVLNKPQNEALLVDSLEEALLSDGSFVNFVHTYSFSSSKPQAGENTFYKTGNTGTPSTLDLPNLVWYDKAGNEFKFTDRTEYTLEQFGGLGDGDIDDESEGTDNATAITAAMAGLPLNAVLRFGTGVYNTSVSLARGAGIHIKGAPTMKFWTPTWHEYSRGSVLRCTDEAFTTMVFELPLGAVASQTFSIIIEDIMIKGKLDTEGVAGSGIKFNGFDAPGAGILVDLRNVCISEVKDFGLSIEGSVFDFALDRVYIYRCGENGLSLEQNTPVLFQSSGESEITSLSIFQCGLNYLSGSAEINAAGLRIQAGRGISITNFSSSNNNGSGAVLSCENLSGNSWNMESNQADVALIIGDIPGRVQAFTLDGISIDYYGEHKTQTGIKVTGNATNVTITGAQFTDLTTLNDWVIDGGCTDVTIRNYRPSITALSTGNQWTQSVADSNEWYLEASGGGTPDISSGLELHELGKFMGKPAVPTATLLPGTFTIDNRDSLPANTFYVRTGNTGDPSSREIQLIGGIQNSGTRTEFVEGNTTHGPGRIIKQIRCESNQGGREAALEFFQQDSTGTASAGTIKFKANNINWEEIIYSHVKGILEVETDGSECGGVWIGAMGDGTFIADMVKINSNGVIHRPQTMAESTPSGSFTLGVRNSTTTILANTAAVDIVNLSGSTPWQEHTFIGRDGTTRLIHGTKFFLKSGLTTAVLVDESITFILTEEDKWIEK